MESKMTNYQIPHKSLDEFSKTPQKQHQQIPNLLSIKETEKKTETKCKTK